jgi:Cys-rich four helix bundle protein (predicted Tat secretion target)
MGRRATLAGVAGLGALLAARVVGAQPKPSVPSKAPVPSSATDPTKMHGAHARKDAPPAAPLSPALAAIVETTAACQRDGRFCLARCTDHLAAGTDLMAECQRSVMNMLAVTAAMANVSGYRNASPKHIKALANACAQFCRACAATCEPHKDHHEECKACLDSCLACAKACEAFSA